MENKLIYKKMSKIMSEIGAIAKKRSGIGIQYKFRGIEDVYLALQVLLVKNEVFFSPKVLSMLREERQTKSGSSLVYTIVTVQFTFFAAEDGSSVEVTTIGEGMDSGDKSGAKAMSTALKTMAFEVFCIPTEEDLDTESGKQHKALPKLPKAAPVGPMVPKPGTPAALKPADVKPKFVDKIDPRQPTAGDGYDPDDGTPEKYRIQYGAWRGKGFKEVEIDKLKIYINKLKTAGDTGIHLPPTAIELIDKAEAYILNIEALPF